MGEKDMYEYWSQTYRVHNLEWSQEKAADILHAWQRKFTQVGALFTVIRALTFLFFFIFIFFFFLPERQKSLTYVT